MIDRREFMRCLGGAATGALLIPVLLSGCAVVSAPTGADPSAAGALSYGNARQRPRSVGDGAPRMVVVFLRGAIDGMNVVVPHGDRDYVAKRGVVAIKPPGEAEGALAGWGLVEFDGGLGLAFNC